jgi:hypothetical protein
MVVVNKQKDQASQDEGIARDFMSRVQKLRCARSHPSWVSQSAVFSRCVGASRA